MLSSPYFPARLFGGASPATGEPAQFALEGDALRVIAGSKSHTVPLRELRLREVGTGSIGLEFAWEADGALLALQVFEPAALDHVRTDARIRALPQMAALLAVRRRGKVVRAFGWSALAVFVLLPVLLIAVFIWQADRIAGAIATRVSIEQETRFGEQAFAAMRPSLDLQDSGPAYEAVQALGRRLTSDSQYRYRFHVAKHDAVNAFAVPGGIIVVHTGLIDATRRPEELAGVLAHEVQHIEQRHSLRAFIKDLGLRGLWMLLTGDLGSGIAGQAALELTSLSFSRGAESEADAKGLELLVEHGIDPNGMADFFVVMAQQQGAAVPPPFLSTHPASEDREQRLRERIARLGAREFRPLEMAPWPPR
jgi:Zn-dependent protease with chaperone function